MRSLNPFNYSVNVIIINGVIIIDSAFLRYAVIGARRV